ncbi:hypothetical protein PTKIN_Ptkin15bG0047100 [Pterospermum kingtungense]
MFKVNFDGAWNSEHNLGSIGIVIRDWKSNIMGAMHSQVEDVATAATAEAHAAVKMLHFAKDLGLHGIALEGDAQGDKPTWQPIRLLGEQF